MWLLRVHCTTHKSSLRWRERKREREREGERERDRGREREGERGYVRLCENV